MCRSLSTGARGFACDKTNSIRRLIRTSIVVHKNKSNQEESWKILKEMGEAVTRYIIWTYVPEQSLKSDWLEEQSRDLEERLSERLRQLMTHVGSIKALESHDENSPLKGLQSWFVERDAL